MNKKKNDRFVLALIGYVSVLVPLLVAILIFIRKGPVPGSESAVVFLPTLNAIINSCVTVLLILGYIMIRKKKRNTHKIFMLSALTLSILFLVSYVIYHAVHGHDEFRGIGYIRIVYFLILTSHVFLSIALVPMALITVYRGLAGRFAIHRKIAKFTLPVWLYVSVTGVIVYYFAHIYSPG